MVIFTFREKELVKSLLMLASNTSTLKTKKLTSLLLKRLFLNSKVKEPFLLTEKRTLLIVLVTECCYELQLSPRTNAITYLIFKQGEKLNDLFLVVYALIISVLGGKIDSLSETIYEVTIHSMSNEQINRPHRCAAYVAQMLRLLLFGATLKEDFDEHIGAIPELVGPLTDLVKKLKISIQPELNAPSAIKGSTLLVSALNNLSYQYTMIMSRIQ